MSNFEKLATIASGNGKAFDLARQYIGIEQLALLIANAAISQTSGELDVAAIAKAFNITEKAALEKTKNIAIKTGQ
jgi:hypothetical protein